MSSTRPSSSLLGIAAGAALVVVGLLAWLWSSKSTSSVAADRRAAATENVPAATPEVVAGVEQETREPSQSEPAVPRAAAPSTPPVDPSALPAREYEAALLAEFVRPNRSVLTVDSAYVELRDERNVVHSAGVQHSKTVRVPGLVRGKYTARVVAPGYEHREQVLELERASESGDGELVFEERLILWPSNWVAVVVRTNDGRDFSAMAVDLGHEPKPVFVKAFQVHTRLDPPGDVGARPQQAPVLAEFHPPRGHMSWEWELPGSCIGALELRRQPPFWVGLDVFGTPAGWELLTAGRSEIVFHLDSAALEERFARVLLRVVEPERVTPVEGALVTLRADTSAHRRADLTEVPTDGDGRVELPHVLPGRYELEITRGKAPHQSQFQQMIEIQPRERRDLGDIALGQAPMIDVLVVDENGKPVSAYVEIGPYEQGRRSGEIYPQNLRHASDPQGRERLAMPSGLAIVRATVDAGRWNGEDAGQEVRGVRSANVLLDPRAMPRGPIRLVLATPRRVLVSTARPEGARVEILDEFDVVVARSAHASVHDLVAELVPGRYRARSRAPDGALGFETPFVVADAEQHVEID